VIELTKLILAHLIGDFFLQSTYGIHQKRSKKWRSPYLYWHSLTHFILILLLFWDLSVWPAALFIAFTHWVIDGVKLSFSDRNSNPRWFFADQIAHLLVIGITWMFYFEQDLIFITNPWFWAAATGLLFVTHPSAYIVQVVLSRWDGVIEENPEQSLFMAGKTIGWMERIVIYIAILAGHMGVIGFMIAAKSIFRFGDLTRAKDRKLTEYILIGTLLSFLLAIAAGVVVTMIPAV